MMNVRVEKLEGRLAVAVPERNVTNFSLSSDSIVEVSEHDGGVILRPIQDQRPSLEELLAQVTDENRHEETDWGPPVGKEVW